MGEMTRFYFFSRRLNTMEEGMMKKQNRVSQFFHTYFHVHMKVLHSTHHSKQWSESSQEPSRPRCVRTRTLNTTPTQNTRSAKRISQPFQSPTSLFLTGERGAGPMTMREIDMFENRLQLKTLQEGLKHKVASVDITPKLVYGTSILTPP